MSSKPPESVDEASVLTPSLFDETASTFAATADSAIAAKTYVRGDLFVATLERTVPPGERVLDYGCGPGRIARLLAERGYVVDAVDPAPMMIAQAEQQPSEGLRLQWRVCGYGGDDLEKGAYAGVVCSSVIEFVPDPVALLTNLGGALRPGGTLLLTFSNKQSIWHVYASRRYRKRLRHLALQHNVWSVPEARAILRAAGLEPFGAPAFLEAAPFDKRPYLRLFSSSRFVGVLTLMAARRRPS